MNKQFLTLMQNQAELSGIVAKAASENRAFTDDEKARCLTLKAENEALTNELKEPTSDGRKSFLSGLGANAGHSGPMVLKSDQSLESIVKAQTPDEFREGLSLGRILKGYVTGDWSGAELEMKAMASTPTSAGGILIPSVLSARVIDLARNIAAVMRAGAVTVPMTSAKLTMARQTSDVTAAWYAEGGEISESDAAFDSVVFTARKMGTMVRVSNELLADAQNIDSVLENSLAQAIALELDRAALLGTGASNQPTGVRNIGGVNTVATVGSPADYDKFLQALFAIRGFNFEPNAAIYSSRTAESLAKLKTGLSGDKTPLAAPSDWANLAKLVSNQVPNNTGTGTNESLAFVGQFNQLGIGLRAGIQIEVSNSAKDVFEKDQTMIRATWRGDVQAFQPKAFTVMSGILA